MNSRELLDTFIEGAEEARERVDFFIHLLEREMEIFGSELEALEDEVGVLVNKG